MLLIILQRGAIDQTHELKNKTRKIEENSNKINLIQVKQNYTLLEKLKKTYDKKLKSIRYNKKLSHVLFYIAESLPAHATLKTLNWKNKIITLTGESDQLSYIHQYNTDLAHKLQWKTQITKIQNERNQFNFTIRAKK